MDQGEVPYLSGWATGWSILQEKWSGMMEPRRSRLPPDGVHPPNIPTESPTCQ